MSKAKETLDKNSIPEPNTGCSYWFKSTTKNGYGTIYTKGKNKLAHRISYIEYNGEIPKGMNVLHRCDVPCCVNPRHLFLGTQKQNITDMLKKNRKKKAFYGWKVLNLEQVKNIKSLLKTGETTQSIAKSLKIKHSTVYAIKNGDSWTSIN